MATSATTAWLKAIGIGIAVSILTALVMIGVTQAGLSPFPQPPSLAFAETVLGRDLPMPVGMLFHTVYVTLWSVVFICCFPRRNLASALGLAAALWLVILVVFFPINGWGFAGMDISRRLIVASAVPHLLFGLLLWGLDRYLGPKRS